MFKENVSSQAAIYFTLVLQIIYSCGCLTSICLINKLGRKLLYVGGLGSQALLLLIIIIVSSFGLPFYITVIFLYIFVYIFGATTAPVTRVILSDLLPDLALGFAVMIRWSGGIVAYYTFPIF